MASKNYFVFKEIAKWKVEAKLEDPERYFYKSLDVEELLDGDKCFVIGRKGTGKTAIASYLRRRSGYDHFASLLTLKNFPFRSLYEYKDKGYFSPNEFITFWKYLIYTKLLYLICDNEKTPEELRREIEKNIPNNAQEVMAKSVERTMSKSFSVGFASFKAGLGFSKNSEKNELDWIDRVDALEEIIFKYIDCSKYFIVFDELDEDYRYQSVMQTDRPYAELITGLFKAAQDVKSRFSENGFNVTPVVFLRDDIYSIISDHDKSKWNDLAIELKWTRYTIQALIAHRIARAIDPQAVNSNFGSTWHRIFSNDNVDYGGMRKKSMSSYEWITRQTLLRPRDYIRYLKICAKKAYEADNHLILPKSVTTQSKIYSSAFRQEFVDEIHTILPDIEKIFLVFTRIKKAYLKPSDFIEAYAQTVKEGWERPNDSAEYILNILFVFSVIGNQTNSGTHHEKNIFRYLDPDSELNMNLSLIIHPGLHKSLQIY